MMFGYIRKYVNCESRSPDILVKCKSVIYLQIHIGQFPNSMLCRKAESNTTSKKDSSKRGRKFTAKTNVWKQSALRSISTFDDEIHRNSWEFLLGCFANSPLHQCNASSFKWLRCIDENLQKLINVEYFQIKDSKIWLNWRKKESKKFNQIIDIGLQVVAKEIFSDDHFLRHSCTQGERKSMKWEKSIFYW